MDRSTGNIETSEGTIAVGSGEELADGGDESDGKLRVKLEDSGNNG